ncbi:hypothetical protein ACFXA3_41905, partial [Streptomyces sp. NPDC059456]|uniref:hypothetical protein n=1 Tax=Streptomyces sp. NPDC059456 TaxID=3346838 RepID=UPI0036882BA0
LALVACLSVVGSSMVASATDELDQSVGADYMIASQTLPEGQCCWGERPNSARYIFPYSSVLFWLAAKALPVGP